ncbi:hypothetical protein [Microbacterium maritypicum]
MPEPLVLHIRKRLTGVHGIRGSERPRRRGTLRAGDAERMLLLVPTTDPVTSPPAWAVLHALALVRAAGADLDDAVPTLVALRADTRWRSDGVDALQEALLGLLVRTRSTRAELADRERELEGVPV